MAVALMIIGLLYVATNVRPPSWPWLTPGAMLAVVVWALTSAGFGLYLANFGSYNKTYGTLGAIVTFLIWVWLTNVAVLLGIETGLRDRTRAPAQHRSARRGHPDRAAAPPRMNSSPNRS